MNVKFDGGFVAIYVVVVVGVVVVATVVVEGFKLGRGIQNLGKPRDIYFSVKLFRTLLKIWQSQILVII